MSRPQKLFILSYVFISDNFTSSPVSVSTSFYWSFRHGPRLNQKLLLETCKLLYSEGIKLLTSPKHLMFSERQKDTTTNGNDDDIDGVKTTIICKYFLSWHSPDSKNITYTRKIYFLLTESKCLRPFSTFWNTECWFVSDTLRTNTVKVIRGF